MDETKVLNLVESEIATIAQPEFVETIRKFLVTPRQEDRGWDYGDLGQTYPCWIVMEDPEINTVIAYCEYGFGPEAPWGLLFLGGPHTSMSMDSNWFACLEDAVRDSWFWDGENPPDYEVR